MRRSEEPRRAAADGFHEGENSPEEDQDAEGDGDFFGGGEAESFGEIEEQEIEEDVVPLPDGVNAGSFALLHELREPGVVDVAAEIAGFDVGMPEARNQKQNGNEEIGPESAGRHCRGGDRCRRGRIANRVLVDFSIRWKGHFRVF